jgi:hypothetical protein
MLKWAGILTWQHRIARVRALNGRSDLTQPRAS